MIKIEENYKVYAHINKINGKIYIGITMQDIKLRWRKGSTYKNCIYFYNAIQKYGWDGFNHEIIASNLTKKEAENFEVLLIDKLNTTDVKFGYNIENGGNTNGKHSEETKQKMSKNSGRAIKVICLTTNKVFDTITKASQYYNIKGSGIYLCCNGINTSCGNYNNTSLRWMYYEDYLKYGIKINIRNKDKKVICINNNQIYGSPIEASLYLGIEFQKINICCSLNTICTIKDNIKYQFMYYGDYLMYGYFDYDSLKDLQKVICITTNVIYDSIKEAHRESAFSENSIARECRKYHFKKEIHAIINKNNEQTVWMYYEDYLRQNKIN